MIIDNSTFIFYFLIFFTLKVANSSNLIKIAIIFAVCIISQLLLFNNLQISGFINPYVYILILLSMPFGTSVPMLMIIGMIAGLCIDIFCDTPGMHAASCVLIGYLRQYILKLIAFRDEYKNDTIPSVALYGITWYLKYAALMVSIHHITLFFIEQFDTLFFWPTLLRIILSIIATIGFIIAAQFFIPTGKWTEEY